VRTRLSGGLEPAVPISLAATAKQRAKRKSDEGSRSSAATEKAWGHQITSLRNGRLVDRKTKHHYSRLVGRREKRPEKKAETPTPKPHRTTGPYRKGEGNVPFKTEEKGSLYGTLGEKKLSWKSQKRSWQNLGNSHSKENSTPPPLGRSRGRGGGKDCRCSAGR